jgi:VWFA-related protein
MRSRSSRPASPARIALAIAAILGALSPRGARPAGAQNSPPPSSAPGPAVQTLHVTTREIVVDVLVTDDHGRPVHGLKQSNFSIAENGKPQPIRSFKEYTSANQPPEPPQVKLPAGVYTNSQSMPVSGPVNIFLLDALHTPQNLMDIAEQQTARYIRTMPDGTRVAIFWLSQAGLHTLAGFTSDRETLLRAIATNRADFGPVGNPTHWTTSMVTVQALNQIAAWVSGIKGRKNLFWIAPGAPVNLMRDGGYSWGSAAGPDMSLVHHLMDTYELLTAAQVAVYPVDPTGPSRMGMRDLRMEAVAEDSGGEAIYNTNDITSALAKAIDEGSQVYTLSYVPPNTTDDGHYHHIDITVDQPGLHLVYRKGYNAERAPTVDAPAPGPALMKASMEGHAPAATQLLFDVGIWPSSNLVPSAAGPQSVKAAKPAAGAVRYEVHFGFPASQIAFAEQPDGTLLGAVEFDAVAYDIYGKRVALLSQTVKMPLRVDQYDDFAAKPIQFVQQLDLPTGQLSLHVGILDTVDNKVGTVEVPVLVTSHGQPQDTPADAPSPCPPRCALPQPSTPSFGNRH